MQNRFLFVALALVAALTMTAQEVDKTKVTGNADAAKKAGESLKGLEDGEKAYESTRYAEDGRNVEVGG